LANARVFTRQSRVSNRRKTGWDVGPNEPSANLSAAGATVWSVGSQATLDGLTVVRIRGEFSIQLRTVTTIGDGFASYSIGICNVTENAAGIGVTAIPSPLTDIGWDGWIWYHSGAAIFGMETTEVSRSYSSFRMPIDSKAMRKTRATDLLVGVIELGTEVGAATLVFSANTRILDKLP